MFTGGRSSGGTVSSPMTSAFGSCVGQDREQPRDLDPEAHLAARLVVEAAERERRAARGLLQPFHRGQLDRLALGDLAPGPVADDHLHRRAQRRERERHDERGAVVVVALALQPRERVDAGDDEPADEVAREVHVDQLVPHVRVQQRLPRARVEHLAVRREVEPDRVVHPAVDRDHVERAREAREHDRDAGQEVRALGEPVPAVDVDRDEDRLDEERDALQREARSRRPRRSGP